MRIIYNALIYPHKVIKLNMSLLIFSDFTIIISIQQIAGVLYNRVRLYVAHPCNSRTNNVKFIDL